MMSNLRLKVHFTLKVKCRYFFAENALALSFFMVNMKIMISLINLLLPKTLRVSGAAFAHINRRLIMS